MKLASVLRDLSADLTQVGVSFAVVGGIAAYARGEPRFTRGVGVVVAVSGDEQAESILFQLGRLGYVVRATVEHDAVRRLATARLQHSSGIVCALTPGNGSNPSPVCPPDDILGPLRISEALAPVPSTHRSYAPVT